MRPSGDPKERSSPARRLEIDHRFPPLRPSLAQHRRPRGHVVRQRRGFHRRVREPPARGRIWRRTTRASRRTAPSGRTFDGKVASLPWQSPSLVRDLRTRWCSCLARRARIRVALRKSRARLRLHADFRRGHAARGGGGGDVRIGRVGEEINHPRRRVASQHGRDAPHDLLGHGARGPERQVSHRLVSARFGPR